MVTDSQGLPLTVEVTAGQVHDSTRLEAVMDQISIAQPIGRPRTRPERLAGDKGYSAGWIRQWLSDRGIEAIIPHRDDERRHLQGQVVAFDKRAYRRRSVIEQCIGWLKECRRIGTRFEKLAINFVAMLKLAMIDRYLRFSFSDRA